MTNLVVSSGRPALCVAPVDMIVRVGTRHPDRAKRNGRSPRPRGDGRFSEAQVGPDTTPVLNQTLYSIHKGKVRDGSL